MRSNLIRGSVCPGITLKKLEAMVATVLHQSPLGTGSDGSQCCWALSRCINKKLLSSEALFLQSKKLFSLFLFLSFVSGTKSRQYHQLNCGTSEDGGIICNSPEVSNLFTSCLWAGLAPLIRKVYKSGGKQVPPVLLQGSPQPSQQLSRA